MFYVPSFTDFSVPLGERKKGKKRKTKENIERNAKKKKKKKQKIKTRKQKGYLPRQLKKKGLGIRIRFLKFVGFLDIFEISHAIGGSYQTFHFLEFMEKRLLRGPADSASSRFVEQENIHAGLKRRYLLFGTISTFQAARIAVPSHRFRCLREIHVPAQWVLLCLFLLRVVYWLELLSPLSSVGRCCLASFFGCCCVFPLPFSGGAAFLSHLWVGFPFSSVGWCLASSFFGSWCFATPHDGLGVGLLGRVLGC